MSKIKAYFEDSFNELVHKVTWPSWKELQGSAILVMIASLILGFLIFLMDTSFSEILKLYYNI